MWHAFLAACRHVIGVITPRLRDLLSAKAHCTHPYGRLLYANVWKAHTLSHYCTLRQTGMLTVVAVQRSLLFKTTLSDAPLHTISVCSLQLPVAQGICSFLACSPSWRAHIMHHSTDILCCGSSVGRQQLQLFSGYLSQCQPGLCAVDCCAP